MRRSPWIVLGLILVLAGSAAAETTIQVRNRSRMVIPFGCKANGKKVSFKAPAGKTSVHKLPSGLVECSYNMVPGGGMVDSFKKQMADRNYVLECAFWDGKAGPGCSCEDPN